MSDQTKEPESGLDVAEPVVTTRRRLSVVWVIPLVAAVIGAWLSYKAITERGPVIHITFKTAEGLEAGKTKIKYKELDMGVVETIELADDLSGVRVTAAMALGAARFLRKGTRFWVVRARVAAGQVSGLGTLFSGAYIGMDPVVEGKSRSEFKGLEFAPVVRTGDVGRLFALRAAKLGSLEIGSPVYFRQVRVGQVVAHELGPTGEFVNIRVFIEAPHDERVHENTRFWNASGLDVTLDSEGVHVDTESVVSLLLGGIAFDTPALSPGAQVGDNWVFPLFSDRRATLAETFTLSQRYLLHFNESVRGLVPGSPVEFRGIRIGNVQDVRLEFDTEANEFRVPVVIELQPERIAIVGGTASDIATRIPTLVERGLRARLKTANLLTGQLAVDLDLFPSAPPAMASLDQEYPELPTIPTPLEEITASLTRLVARLERVPLEQIGEELTSSLVALRKTLEQTEILAKNLNTELAPALLSAAQEAENALAAAGTLVGPDSATTRELNRTLLELIDAARAVRLAAERLEQEPESLLRGKEVEP